MRNYFLLFLICFLFNFSTAFSQPGTWTWISGDSAMNQPGIFGTQGVSSPTNVPPALYSIINWMGKDGTFWIYGGVSATSQSYSDLWKYDPVINEWTWINGTGLTNVPPSYGVKGVASLSNNPGKRNAGCPAWTDTAGNFWFMGGYGVSGRNNDLWKYDISLNQWVWMKGANTSGQSGIYGTLGIPNNANRPGARDETCANWTDSQNNLWVFGGNAGSASLNDLWRYNVSTNQWTWMSGSNTVNQSSNYGTKGVASITNIPSARRIYSKLTDSIGNLYIFGGGEYDGSTFTNRNDLWKYDISTNMWTWISGTNIPNDVGNHGTKCSSNVNYTPSSRYETRSTWVDHHGNFWVFGGFYYITNPGNFYNDLWKYNLTTNEWTWVSGDSIPNQAGVYGIKGVSNSTNKPGARAGSVSWYGLDSNLYMLAGTSNTAATVCRNDLWKYIPDSNCPQQLNLPVVNLASSDTLWCDKTCIDFFDLSTNNPTSWQWYFPGAQPDTSTVQNPTAICYNNYGSFDVTLIACNGAGCDSIYHANFINEYQLPQPPVVTQNGNLLTSTPAYSYQWYNIPNLITGATAQTYLITQSGNYYVLITDSLGCQIPSNVITNTGITGHELPQWNVSVIPNPNKGEFKISMTNLFTKELKITINDILGRVIYTSIEKNINGKLEKEISLKNIDKGVYYLNLFDNEMYAAKIILTLK